MTEVGDRIASSTMLDADAHPQTLSDLHDPLVGTVRPHRVVVGAEHTTGGDHYQSQLGQRSGSGVNGASSTVGVSSRW